MRRGRRQHFCKDLLELSSGR